MQVYLPILQSTFSDWLHLTRANPWYAAALIIAAFLLTAIVYGIRLAMLKKNYTTSESARKALADNLATAQTHAAELKEFFTQRSRQISSTIQALAADFKLGEEPVAVGDDPNSDSLWQQHNRIVSVLASRLQSEQQGRVELQKACETERARRIEKDALVESLQAALTDKIDQLSRMEHALEEQKALLLEEQEKAQQILTQVIEKHMAETARLAELEQQTLDWANSKLQLMQLQEQLHSKESEIKHMQTEIPVVQAAQQPVPDTLAVLKEQPATETTTEKVMLSDWEEQAESPSLPEPIEAPAVEKKTTGIAGKFKNLFGKPKTEPVAETEETAEILPAEEDKNPEPETESGPSSSSSENRFDKLRNLFGKSRHEPKQDSEPVETAQARLGDQADTENESTSSENIPKGRLKKITSLFGKGK